MGGEIIMESYEQALEIALKALNMADQDLDGAAEAYECLSDLHGDIASGHKAICKIER